MFRIIPRERRGTVLRHPLLPCLSPHYTINLSAGCPNRCVYCYAKSYTFHPGDGNVVYYANTFRLLESELLRKRRKPCLVYFSTASEPFLPVPRILSDLYRIMRLLLDYGVFILISTKSHIPDNFISLFEQFPGKVHVQVGMITINDGIRRTIEPNAASVSERMDNLLRLCERGIRAEVRIDPLIPCLTDTDESFDALLKEAHYNGVPNAVASYLFLRPTIEFPGNISYNDWSFKKHAVSLYTHRVTDYCGHGIIWIPNSDYRRTRYKRLKEIAASHRISLNLCRCKNKDITDECCHPEPPETDTATAQMNLF